MTRFYKLIIALTLFIPVSHLFSACSKTSSAPGYLYLPSVMEVTYLNEPEKSGRIEFEYNSFRQITAIKKHYTNNDSYVLTYTYDDFLKLTTINKVTEEGTTKYEIAYDDINNSYIPLSVKVITPDNQETDYPVTVPTQHNYQIAAQTMHINPEYDLLGINQTSINFNTNAGIFNDAVFQLAFYLGSFDTDFRDFSFFAKRQINSSTTASVNYNYTSERNGNNSIIKYEVFTQGTQTKVMENNIQYQTITIPGE
ncbi:hypothetical protein [Gynurincola endophyticus]|uniref:hypothetical protein n=1 Tax=Gynurincola endophyticus TaxID=2479004 RepID=UPI000F8D06C9|nr:hypothetical protein [Gynurincola endophyticus]